MNVLVLSLLLLQLVLSLLLAGTRRGLFTGSSLHIRSQVLGLCHVAKIEDSNVNKEIGDFAKFLKLTTCRLDLRLFLAIPS